MRFFMMKDEGDVYRVRKEDVGCSIFTPENFVEGDDVLFEVLQVMHERGVPTGIEELRSRYQAEPGQIEADLWDLSECFLENNIFRDLSSQIQSHLNGVRPS